MSEYTLHCGDALSVLRTLPAESVQTCITSPPYFGLRSYLDNGHDDKHMELGTEASPEAYVARLVDVFREVRRVLHPSGTVWLNLGDSYNGSGGAGGDYGPGGLKEGQPKYPGRNVGGLKPKDLMMIPAMVAFALRADGWWLRQDIVWNKIAPMPESVTDRCTKAHEYLFLLAKSEHYYFDNEAIKEQGSGRAAQNRTYKYDGVPGHETKQGILSVADVEWHTRNKRSVWTLGPEQFPGSHFATMPTKLVEPCVLAGTSAHGCCAACGAPWERVVERKAERYNEREGIAQALRNQGATNGGTERVTLGVTEFVTRTTTDWAATCTCAAAVVPQTVLDPFSGAATVGVVATKHGRNYIGIDLSAEYNELGRLRIEQSQPMLLAVT